MTRPLLVTIAVFIPSFEFYNDAYIINKQLHVTDIEEMIISANIKKRNHDVTYFEFADNLSYEDYINGGRRRIDSYLDKVSVKYNDFKIHRRQESIELYMQRQGLAINNIS